MSLRDENMKRESLILLVVLLVVSMFAFQLPVSSAGGDEVEIVGHVSLDFDVLPHEYAGLNGVTFDAGSVEGKVPYNVDMVDVEKVSATGEDIYIAVLDTGLLENWMEYLPVENIVTEWGKGFSYEYCYWNETAQAFYVSGFYDTRGFITHPLYSGHGTHVVSTITGFKYVSATYGQEFWVRGVASNVKIIPVLVLDAWIVYVPANQSIPEGYYLVTGGTDEMIAAGIRYVADLAEEQGIKVIISMSLGGSSPLELIEDAINYAIKKGCIVVAAAGNEGEAGMSWPGAYPQVISVAAGGWTMQWIGSGESSPPEPYRWWLSDVPECLWQEDALGNKFQVYLTDFSSRPNPSLGQRFWYLDVCAPGAWVVGPYKPTGFTIEQAFGYYYVSGTSMATPHVSAIAALVLEKYPDLNQKEMETILKTAACLIRMTCGFKPASATIRDYVEVDGEYQLGYVTVTWGPFDYGAGFLQADNAILIANLYKTLRSCQLFCPKIR